MGTIEYSTRHLTVVEVIRGFSRVVDKTSIEFRLVSFCNFFLKSASEGVKSDLLLDCPEDHCKMDVIIIIVHRMHGKNQPSASPIVTVFENLQNCLIPK